MKNVFKCRACEDGPCYCQNERFYADPAGFGENGIMTPDSCPNPGEGHEAKWELLPNRHDAREYESLVSWFSGAGYNAAPVEIRDEILSFGLDGYQVIDLDRARQIFRLLCDQQWNFIDLNEFDEQLKKVKKREIVAGVLVEAFRMGIIWREKFRQENGK